MKRVLSVIVLFFLLCGCSENEDGYNKVMTLRSKLQKSAGCTFVANITADYGQWVYVFDLYCESDSSGNIKFEVISPENIAGISGTISNTGGALNFDDQTLAFDLLAEGCATPVSAPWLIMRGLLGGYINACTVSDEGLMVQIDDSYHEDPLTLELWTDRECLPVRADIMWQGRRILAVEIKDFSVCD